MGSLGRYIWFGDVYDYDDILARGLSQIEFRAETQVRSRSGMQSSIGFEELVHPVIVAHAFRHNVGGHYPGAGLNSIVAIFDLMRERIGLDLNGVALAMQALSLEIASPSTEVRTVYTKIRTRPTQLGARSTSSVSGSPNEPLADFHGIR